MAMISKSAKQPMEGAAAAASPFAAAEGSKKTANGSDGGAWSADMRAPKHYGNLRTGDNTPGARGAISKGVNSASEDVTKGMGGRVINDMK